MLERLARLLTGDYKWCSLMLTERTPFVYYTRVKIEKQAFLTGVYRHRVLKSRLFYFAFDLFSICIPEYA